MQWHKPSKAQITITLDASPNPAYLKGRVTNGNRLTVNTGARQGLIRVMGKTARDNEKARDWKTETQGRRRSKQREGERGKSLEACEKTKFNASWHMAPHVHFKYKAILGLQRSPVQIRLESDNRRLG